MRRHNASKGHNSLQLLFKIYYSLIASCLPLGEGFTVTIGSYPLPCVCVCVCVCDFMAVCVCVCEMIMLRSHLISPCSAVPTLRNISDAFTTQEATTPVAQI